MSDTNQLGNCPICSKDVPISDIEVHVNRCLFLNTDDHDESHKRKRTPSPLVKKTIQKSSEKSKNLKKRPNFPPVSAQSSSSKQEETDVEIVKQQSNIDKSFKVPLAKQLQPKTLDDYFGQDTVLGKNSFVRNLLEKGDIPNMILWGPPGCGKTSLSSVICEMCKKVPNRRFVSLNATKSGVKEVQNIVTIAKNEQKFGIKTVLFMDEIHRFNKMQQDTFLSSVEKGEIILIGATTENPSFRLNNALLSRCNVVVLEKLNMEDLFNILVRATERLEVGLIDTDNPCANKNDNTWVTIEESALKWLASTSDGDARIALSNLQLILQNCNEKGKTINTEDIKEGIKKSHMLYDRAGEEHYNTISAMHKSIRGSDENAALYYTTRMIVSGEDPLYIAKRMVRAASEDIGNADPQALQLATATMQGCQLLGMPECDVLLAQCAIYLARAPKSREADTALARAKKLIQECEGAQPSVPMHLRNAPTKLMKNLGYGTLQQDEFTYMPIELKNVNFFK